ncbi:MAG: 8-oxo-dGTP diphosphatase [Candidatus Buchananbacteria bacterium]
MADYPVQKLTNLCYVINEQSEVLLIMKKRGFGAGKWNGPGGKVKTDESPKAAAIREVKEEVGLDIKNLTELGFIEFIWPDHLIDYNQRCHIYLTKEFSGEPRESDECRPAWFALDQIPYDQMWDDDKYWYPEALAGKAVKKRFFLNENNKIIKYEDI